MNIPLISVVMPCYNAEKYLVPALNSICNQTYHNLEILLINDGSKDNTLNIIKDYASKDSRIKVINNDVNIGLIRTLNKGISLASGEFIARMDADDISELNRIEILHNYFHCHPEAAVVSSGNKLMDQNENELQTMLPKATVNTALKFVSFFSTPIVHASLLGKAKVLKANPYNENYIHSEDYELFSRLILNNVIFANVNTPLYNIRINLESVSYQFESTQIETTILISKNNLKHYFNLEIDPILHSVIANRIKGRPNVGLFVKAFKKLRHLKTTFIDKENCSKIEVAQIEDFLTEQKIDILIQAIKLSSGLNKIMHFIFLLLNVRLYTSKRGFNYLKNKLDHKRKKR